MINKLYLIWYPWVYKSKFRTFVFRWFNRHFDFSRFWWDFFEFVITVCILKIIVTYLYYGGGNA